LRLAQFWRSRDEEISYRRECARLPNKTGYGGEAQTLLELAKSKDLLADKCT